MNDEHRTPGTGLRALAERMFDRTTLERVILPALADLQHECATDAGSTLRRRWICWRAYWSVWKTFGLCFVADIARDPQGVSRTIGVRTLICLAALVPVFLVPGIAAEVLSLSSRLTVAESFKLAVLVLPQAVVPCLPAAFFFALVLYRDDDRPHGTRVLPSLVAGTLACTVAVGLLSGIVVPKANQAYRLLVFQSLERRAVDYGLRVPPLPEKGPSEMTWWELNEHIAHPPSSYAESRARARRWEHVAFVGLVPVLALLGYGLSNRGQSRGAMFGVALTLQTLYYVCFSLGVSNFGKPYIYGPWTVNALFLIVALWLLGSPSTLCGRQT
jgi:lipopolysaccharide export LptBFGC system permease protein LptF